MGSRKLKLGLAVLVPTVAAGAAYFAFGHSHSHGSPPPGAGRPGVKVRVRIVRPEEGGVERKVTRPAEIHSFRHAGLFAKVSGFLRNQTADIGDAVKKDQLLAEIFAPEIEANVQKAAADLRKAKASVEVAKARVEESQADLRQAKAKLEQSRADVESAQAMVLLRKEQYRRIRALAQDQAIQQEIVDEKREARSSAEASARAATKAVATAEAGVSAAEAALKRTRADEQDAEAQVQVAQAGLDRAKAFQEYTRIRAPFDGVITKRNYDDGDFIRDAASGGTTPLLDVACTDKMRVIVWVPDPDVPYTHKGDPAELRVDPLPGKVFKGKVARTARSEDYNSRSMRTEVDLPNPDGVLENGMFGRITLSLGRTKEGLTVPSACLVGEPKNGERSVYVVRGGKAHMVKVRVGLDDGIRAEALTGLKPDDEVVVRHGPGLNEGAAVAVVKGGG